MNSYVKHTQFSKNRSIFYKTKNLVLLKINISENEAYKNETF